MFDLVKNERKALSTVSSFLAEQVHRLHLKNCGIVVIEKRQLENLRELSDLDLSFNLMGNASLATILYCLSSQLKRLRLRKCNITKFEANL